MTSTGSDQRPARLPDHSDLLTPELGADLVLRSLEAQGVTTVFGMPGGAILPIYDALARGSSLRHVLVRHEQGAGHMAQGYARAGGSPGVVFATSGPGATNLVTPIADAQMDSTPLLCITGQVRSSLIGTNAFQECDITAVTTPIVKRAWQVREVSAIPAVIAEAYRLTLAGRPGPVLVDIPRDVQEAVASGTGLPPDWFPDPEARDDEPDRAAVAAVCDRLRRAARPILYVGGGVLNAGATAELLELAETAGLPVVTTLMAKGAFPEDHPQFCGWPGMHGTVWANRALNGADVILAVGARFDDRVTGRLDRFAPDAAVVHFDIDPREIGKIRTPEIAVVGALRLALRRVRDGLLACPAQDPAAWRAQIATWRERHPLRFDRDAATLKPQRVLEVLQEAAESLPDVIWTTGVGQHQMWAMQYLRCPRPHTFITSGGHGTMGYGVPAAIGAKAAFPGSTVVCVDGDGSFQMTMQEITTSVAERLPIVVVILNNGHLGMVQQWQTMYYDERDSHVDLTQDLPDYAALARALGAEGACVASEGALGAALEAAFAAGRTTVIDARVERFEQCYPMIPPGAAATDMVEWPG
jgi:acetolactate synthase-1/2/3 large subunit